MTGSKHFKGPTDPAADPVMADVLRLGKPGERREGPSTFVGRVGLQPGLGFAAENERLKAERAEGMVIVRLDPKTIGNTQFANRHKRGLNVEDPHFRQLKQSILANGQDTPIKVRPSSAGSGIEYEIVEGHRRHAAILELDREIAEGFPILARLDAKASDSKNLVLKMYRENAERADLSPYEIGTMFSQWLTADVFASQRAIGEAIGQSEQNIGKYVSTAALPDHVIRAFGDPRVIALRWSSELAKAHRDHPDAVREAAMELIKQDPPATPEVVFAALTRAASTAGIGARATATSERASESIKEGNKVLFELSAREGRYGIRLGKHVDKKLRKPLQRDLKDWLHAWLRNHSGGSSQ